MAGVFKISILSNIIIIIIITEILNITLPSPKSDFEVSEQNSIRFDRYLSGAHRYRVSFVQFLLFAAISNSDEFMGHLSTGYTSNR